MKADPVRLARRILEDSGYPGARLDVAAPLELHGLRWHRWPFSHLRGALVRVCDGEYLVVTSALLPPSDQRLAAAHELGHYLMHRGRAPQMLLHPLGSQEGCCSKEASREMELQADAFARELLTPGAPFAPTR